MEENKDKFKNTEIIIDNNINIDFQDNLTFSEILPEIKKQLKNICKIIKKDGNIITGFLCKIPYPNSLNLLPVLISSSKIIENDNDKEINVKLIDDESIKTINLNKKE